MIHDNYDPERDAADIKHLVIGLIMGLIACALITMCTGCTTTKYVPVESQHTEHHWHTDSIYERDSVIKESLTTVMQLDSAAMAKYGIQMKSAERAWLVKSQELERQIQQMMQLSATKDTVRDSVPVPYPVEKLVPAELTWWQQTRLHIANIMLWALLIAVVVWVGKRHIKKLLP